ncbi:chlorite dismutase family protein [Glaciihabitans sp. INWT7]|uniref:hydrogen peroxide-dependent heme synthase n=1 Tax=Glaciihabitans sp. INWT7 TaxID=2596912 RepID=UPI001862AF41|nr:hydrogen peroxide-dependent heme synthase [Glaciihabitans sp. INWT7]QNE45550.1 chlorite dismutase family protein [Glaciihabitans sp. INWT7]
MSTTPTPNGHPLGEPATTEDHTTTGYTLWAVFRRDGGAPAGDDVASVSSAVAEVEAAGVTVRGFYDVSSLRADADLMIWLHGGTPETLQWALRELRRSTLLRTLLPTWNAMGVHVDAEFSASHRPAFMRDKEPEAWLTVYPFVRSYEWYILPEEERRGMLADHGRKGGAYPQVLANTVASFALGDYEWILALEAPQLVDLVDLMRHLRQTEARRHVREEVPFYTGRRIAVSEIAEVLR